MLLSILTTAAASAALPQRAADRPRASDVKAGEELSHHYCVSCHVLSPPDVLPRASWRGEIEKMALLFEGKPMPGWGQPRPAVTLSEDYQKILAYYEARAPVALP